MTDLMDEIVEYTSKRQYVMPNIWQAMGWVNTEIAEVYELMLDREAGWVRNHPENKPIFSEDGFVLNRIFKTIRIIQGAMIELLKEEDVLGAWKAKYNEIVFVDQETMDVKRIDKALTLYYPFNNVDAPLIKQEAFTSKLLSTL